jgi:tetratricopeptide (TPR) repeat protein
MSRSPAISVFGSILLVAGAGMIGLARADVVELAGGGRIEGRLLEDQKTDTALVIQTPSGVRLTIPRSEIERVDSVSQVQAQYEALAHASPDTVEAHWKLAEWCRERDLRDEAHEHLERILELDPDHAEARRLLGYHKENGHWMSRDEVMASRGMVKYGGRYVTRQHVELLEQAKKLRESDAEWNGRLDHLRRALVGRRADRADQAQQEILSLHDPAAAGAVVDMLRREKDPAIRQLWLRAASQIDDPVTLEALVHLSLYDPDPETRRQCLDYVIRSKQPGIATPYIRALRSPDNAMINRAAAALGQIGDKDAIGPLIDVLVTKHTVAASSDKQGQYAITFTPSGGSGFSFGGGGPKTTTRWVRNPSVLSALVTLAGTSFDYDQDQWRAWLAAQAKLNRVDVRRDR